METRLAKDKGEAILQRCGFWNGWEHPREGLSGSLLVGWLQNLKLDIQYSSKHLIHANLLDFKGLCELEAKGQRYTWMNGRENEAFVMERLDKAYASIEWINSYPHYALQNHPILRSDHGSILLEFELQHPFRRRPFRFERMWLNHTDCKEIVEKAWKTHSVGSRAFKLQQKLKSVKKQLIEKIAMTISCAEETIIDISLFGEPNWDPDCCIYKVPKRLRNVKNAAYTPKLILIGPVHHNREEPEDMKIMETLKKRYFRKFFSRTTKVQEDFEKIVEENKDKIRHCYAEEITLPEGKNFVDMILLDSIFIIELFLRSDAKEEENDYILSKPWLKDGVRQDLILLENQVPFFILDELYQDFATSTGYQASFLTLACKYFFNSEENICDEKKVKHFTDLQRYFFKPPNQKPGDPIEHRHSATKLEMAGLIFQTQKGPEKKRSLLNVQIQKCNKLSKIFPCFNCSWLWRCIPCLKKIPYLKRMQTHLVVPHFVVDNKTEDLFRNLMALEQCHYPKEAYICNYILLLDFLINNKDDVELLVEEGIIVHSLGSNEAVADMYISGIFGEEQQLLLGS
nr:upf0481 protein [Quercus suber]